MKKINLTVEQAEQLQREVSFHLETCWEYLNWINYDTQDEELPEQYQEVDMFCGCDVCTTREYLISTFKSLKDMGIIDIAVE